jgi:hypothetical protein
LWLMKINFRRKRFIPSEKKIKCKTKFRILHKFKIIWLKHDTQNFHFRKLVTFLLALINTIFASFLVKKLITLKLSAIFRTSSKKLENCILLRFFSFQSID